VKEEAGVYSLAHTFSNDDLMLSNGSVVLYKTTGLHYFFIYRAVNSVGSSPFSDEINVMQDNYPSKPTTPTKVDLLSSLTSIYVTWDPLIANDLNVLGYVLYMDSENDGDFNVVLNGKGMPGVNYKLIEGTTTGKSYSFKVQAVNFNGTGPLSDVA
jgi:hypothetical protein